jgi:hypothetical protein
MLRWQPWPLRYILARRIIELGSASRACCKARGSNHAAITCLQVDGVTAAALHQPHSRTGDSSSCSPQSQWQCCKPGNHQQVCCSRAQPDLVLALAEMPFPSYPASACQLGPFPCIYFPASTTCVYFPPTSSSSTNHWRSLKRMRSFRGIRPSVRLQVITIKPNIGTAGQHVEWQG